MTSNSLAKPRPNEKDEVVLSSLIDYLVRQSPRLESLGKAELKTVAKAVVFDNLKDNLKRRVEIEKIDYSEKREIFLSWCAKKSGFTLVTYGAALDLIDEWAGRAGVQVLDMKGSHADAFIDSLQGSPSTVRLRVAGASSFFAFLERETDGRVRNPFRGTLGIIFFLRFYEMAKPAPRGAVKHEDECDQRRQIVIENGGWNM